MKDDTVAALPTELFGKQGGDPAPAPEPTPQAPAAAPVVTPDPTPAAPEPAAPAPSPQPDSQPKDPAPAAPAPTPQPQPQPTPAPTPEPTPTPEPEPTPGHTNEAGFKLPDSITSLYDEGDDEGVDAPAAAATTPADDGKYANDEARQMANFWRNNGTREELAAYETAVAVEGMSDLDAAVAEMQLRFPSHSRAELVRGLEGFLGGALEERTEAGEGGVTKTVKPEISTLMRLQDYAEKARTKVASGKEAFLAKAQVTNNPAAPLPGAGGIQEAQAGSPVSTPAVAAGPSEGVLRVARELVSENRTLQFDLQAGDEVLQLRQQIPDEQIPHFERAVADFIEKEKAAGGLKPSETKSFQDRLQQLVTRFYHVMNPDFSNVIARSAYASAVKNVTNRDKGLGGKIFGAGASVDGGSSGKVPVSADMAAFLGEQSKRAM